MPAFSPTFTLTPLMLRQLKVIDQTAGFLAAVETQAEWVEQLRHEARVRDALASLRIEGSTLSYEEAFELAEGKAAGALRPSEQEFVNYLRAFDAIDDLRGERDYHVRRADVQNLHRLLVDGVRGGQRFAGQLRREEVSVGDRHADEVVVHHQPPHWGAVEEQLDDLMAWTEAVKEYPKRAKVLAGAPDDWVHPCIVAGIAQHRLVWIHPFVDGNGRTARLLSTLLLYQRGYDFKYLFDLSSYYDKNRDAYYENLRDVDRTGDYTRWLMYFLGGLSMQMFVVRQKALQAAKGLAHGDTADRDEP
ncbi:MAG: Fic family protein [Deltaproteobacteria bacterium]|nr:MAG: Fic family protein [Deltaproteobacteria bacterium]